MFGLCLSWTLSWFCVVLCCNYNNMCYNSLFYQQFICLFAGRVFVHEWAHLRWGVFDEYSETQPFYHSKGRIEATR